MINKIKKKDSWVLTGLFVFFLMGLMSSRYAGGHLFNGENFISKSFYLLPILLLVGFTIYYYVQYFKGGDKSFEEIEKLIGIVNPSNLASVGLLTNQGFAWKENLGDSAHYHLDLSVRSAHVQWLIMRGIVRSPTIFGHNRRNFILLAKYIFINRQIATDFLFLAI